MWIAILLVLKKIGEPQRWFEGNAQYYWRSAECVDGSWAYDAGRVELVVIDGLVAKIVWEWALSC